MLMFLKMLFIKKCYLFIFHIVKLFIVLKTKTNFNRVKFNIVRE